MALLQHWCWSFTAYNPSLLLSCHPIKQMLIADYVERWQLYFLPVLRHSLPGTLIWCTVILTHLPPHSLLSSPLPPLDLFEPPGSDTPMITNHQLSPWWWWRCCQGNHYPGQRAPVAAWAMTISENKVPGVFRIEVGGEWGRVLMVVLHHQIWKGLTFTHRPGPDINTTALT